MESPNALLRRLRAASGLSQRALARRAGTSQPAVTRYETGVAMPSWKTMERLAAACGYRLRIGAEMEPDPHDVELAEVLLELTPPERLRALGRYARLRDLARGEG